MRINILLFSFISFIIIHVGNGGPGLSKAFTRKDIEKFCKIAYEPDKIQEARDVLPQICSYLKMADMCSVREVCKDFKNAADYELSKRGPQVNIVPIKRNRKFGPLTNILNITPRIALFFTNKLNTNKLQYESDSRNLMANYVHQLPKNSKIYHFIGELVKLNEQMIPLTENQAIALFLHETPRIKIRTSALDRYHALMNLGRIDLNAIFLRDSFPDEKSIKRESNPYAYIIVTVKPNIKRNLNDAHIKQRILKGISDRYRRARFGIWGGNFNNFAAGYSASVNELSSIGSSISGPGVKSWSLLINTAMSEEDIKKKITQFKNAITLKSEKSVVLVAQSMKKDQSNANRIFMQNFPKVQFITYNMRDNEEKYCVDSWMENDGVPNDKKNKLDFIKELVHGTNENCYLFINYV